MNADRIALPCANEVHVLEITIPMTDPDTGECRTAAVTLNKRTLWQTESGQVVRGVTVTWTTKGEG